MEQLAAQAANELGNYDICTVKAVVFEYAAPVYLKILNQPLRQCALLVTSHAHACFAFKGNFVMTHLKCEYFNIFLRQLVKHYIIQHPSFHLLVRA